MSLLGIDHWLKIPPDRDVIARWTVGAGREMQYALELRSLPEEGEFEFLALGDTGDSETSGPQLSPQDAVARELAVDAALPGSAGRAPLILHLGDVVYMTGERRLYDRNFRRPYAAFLTPESTAEQMVFRLPFLPVPGNHDYYDLGGWGMALARLPLLGAGLRAIAHEFFAFSLPEGGSEQGKAYMQAFVDARADTTTQPLPYRPGEQTLLPNRYYRFRVGSTEFFALDSNTLDAPAPTIDAVQVRADAAQRVRELEARARTIDRELRRDQTALDRWCDEQRGQSAGNPDRMAALAIPVSAVAAGLAALTQTLRAGGDPHACARVAVDAATTAARRWAEAEEDRTAASTPAEAYAALHSLDEASGEICAALRALEGCLIALPEGPERAALLTARAEIEAGLAAWQRGVRLEPPPEALCARLRRLSEEALDTQRELALAQRRSRYRPEDHDAAQIEWLRAGLAQAERERPGGWRIVYLHHPLFSTIGNHCEHPAIQAVRENLLAVLQGRVHLILAGHSHAFEWLRSSALPETGLIVSGGGGQVSLRRSVLEPSLLHRSRDRYDRLRRAGVVESAVGGRGPAATDGEDGPVYHYLRVEVTPDALTVRPVGVRRLATGYRRETPMRVFHTPELGPARPARLVRALEGVEIRRGQRPRPLWA